jgi:hypothetical protein
MKNNHSKSPAISNVIFKIRDLCWQYTITHHKITFLFIKHKSKNVNKSEEILKENAVRMKFCFLKITGKPQLFA